MMLHVALGDWDLRTNIANVLHINLQTKFSYTTIRCSGGAITSDVLQDKTGPVDVPKGVATTSSRMCRATAHLHIAPHT